MEGRVDSVIVRRSNNDVEVKVGWCERAVRLLPDLSFLKVGANIILD